MCIRDSCIVVNLYPPSLVIYFVFLHYSNLVQKYTNQFYTIEKNIFVLNRVTDLLLDGLQIHVNYNVIVSVMCIKNIRHVLSFVVQSIKKSHYNKLHNTYFNINFTCVLKLYYGCFRSYTTYRQYYP